MGNSESAAGCSMVVSVPWIRGGVIRLLGQRQGAPLRVSSCGGRVEHDHW